MQCLAKLGRIIVFSVVTLGCKTIHNTINETKLVCGREYSPYKVLVQPLDQNGSPFSNEQLKQFEYGVIDSSGVYRHTGMALSRGCVEFDQPKDGEQIAFFSNQLHLGGTLNDADLDAFNKLTLRSDQTQLFPIECPDQGFYANKSLANPWKAQVSNAGLYHAQITARKTGDKATRVLFNAGFGSKRLELPGALDTSGLDEGVYVLGASIKAVNPSMAVGTTQTADQECRMTIIHNAPEIVRDQVEIPVSKPKELMAWSVPPAEYENRFCLQKNPASNGCMAEGACTDTAKFAKGNIFAPDENGVYRAYFYRTDKAGNQSPLSCHSIVVNDSNSNFVVKWAKEEWNHPIANMELPYGTLAARVEFDKSNNLTEELNNRLECKVDFMSAKGISIQGNAAKCLNGKCSGKTLGEFTPCSDEITFKINDAFKAGYAVDSLVKITFRLVDGQESSETHFASVWANSTRWALSEAVDSAPEMNGADHFYFKNNLYAQTADSFYVWQENNWQKLSPEDASWELLDRIIGDESIFATFQIGKPAGVSDKPQVVIARLENTKWVALRKVDYYWPGRSYESDQVFLISDDDYNFHLFDTKTQEYLKVAAAHTGSDRGCGSTQQYVDRDSRTLYTKCARNLFYKSYADKDWSNVPIDMTADTTSEFNFSNGNLMYFKQINGDVSSLVLFDVKKKTSTEINAPLDSGAACSFTFKGQPYCKEYVFNSTSNTFEFDKSAEIPDTFDFTDQGDYGYLNNVKDQLRLPLYAWNSKPDNILIAKKTSEKSSAITMNTNNIALVQADFKENTPNFNGTWEDENGSLNLGLSDSYYQIVDNEVKHFNYSTKPPYGARILKLNNRLYYIGGGEINVQNSDGTQRQLFNSKGVAISINGDIVSTPDGSIWYFQYYTGFGFGDLSFFRITDQGTSQIKFGAEPERDYCYSLWVKGTEVHCYSNILRHLKIDSTSSNPSVAYVEDKELNSLRTTPTSELRKLFKNGDDEYFLIADSDPVGCKIFFRSNSSPVEIKPFDSNGWTCGEKVYFISDETYLAYRDKVYKKSGGKWVISTKFIGGKANFGMFDQPRSPLKLFGRLNFLSNDNRLFEVYLDR